LQPLEKYCNALSNNMFTLTFVRPIDLVGPFNINGSFYNTTIIKQNNMAYQHKAFFCIRDGFGYGFGVGNYIPVTRPIPMFWNQGKPKPIPKLSQNGENPSNWVWFEWVTTNMGFVAMSTRLVLSSLHQVWVEGYHCVRDYLLWQTQNAPEYCS
jgi:hypothetical protein